MGNRISTEDLYKITQSLADRAVSDVKKRREDERKREEAIKKNREERLAAAAKQNRIPNYKGGSLWDQYKAALASGEAKNANDFITKRDARNAAWNKVGAETLNDDMEALAKSISSTYGTQFDPSKYYSQETINGSSDQVKKMRDRLNALAEYYNTYGGSDDQKKAVGEQIKAYDSELKFLNDLGAHYGQYKNEADFNYRTDKRRDEDYIVNDYDAEAGKKNLAELKGYLDRINTSSDSLSTGQLVSNARSGKKAYNRTAINEAKRQYGLDGMTDDEVLNWLTQEYQLESFALNNVDRMRTAAGYRNLANNEDFLQGVISGKAVENPTFEDYLNYENAATQKRAEAYNKRKASDPILTAEDTKGQDAPSIVNKLRFYEDLTNDKYGNKTDSTTVWSSDLGAAKRDALGYHYGLMTDDEKRVYYYLLGTQGKEAADKYLEDMDVTLDYRNTEEVKQFVRDLKNSKIFGNVSAAALANTFGGLGGAALGYLIADSNEGINKTAGDIAYSAASVPANVIGGGISTVGEIGQRLSLASKGDWEGKGYNPYENYNLFSVAGREARGLVAKDIEDKIGWEMFGQNVMSQVYQSLMSGVDSAFGMATLGRLYTISMGGSAAASKAAELYESGASSSQIYWESLLSGIAEATFEYLSMERLLSVESILKSKPHLPRDVVKKILVQNGVEASEEIFTEIANTIIDKISKGYDSDYDRKVTEYVRDGMTREEAVRKAAAEVAADIGWAGAGGFISGLPSSTLRIIAAYRAGNAGTDAQIASVDPGNAEGLYNNAKNIDYSILNDVAEALKNGDTEGAAEMLSDGEAWYKRLQLYANKKYGKNQASEISANIDASIDNLNQIKNLISSGNINADSIQAVLEKAKNAQDAKVDVTSANDEKLFSLLAKGEPSNSVIEKNILKDRGTLAAFERLTGLRIGGTTVSQKRADVREAFKAVSSSTETLKAAQNAIESGATATEGHKNAAVIIDQAIQANRAENSRLRNSEKVKSAETKAAIDATNRQHRFLETVRNYVINGGDLSGFTESPVAGVSGEASANSSEAKTTQETAKKRVRADFSAYQDEITATEYNKAVKGSAAEQYTYFSNEEKKLNNDIKNIAESEAMTAEEKAEAIEKKNEEKNRLFALAKSTENVREMMRVKYAGNVDRLVEELQPKLKKYGIKIDVVDNIDTAGKSSSGAYFDRNTNTIKVSRNWDNFNNVVKLVLTGDGLAVTDRASVSFDRAVTQTIAHEIAHADSGLTLDFIKAVAGTQYDAFDLKGRLEHPDDRSWRSEDAQKEKNWRRYVDAYTEQAMLEMKGTEEQRRASAEKVVNDAYIFEEIMADMFGAAVDDMGHSSKAGENIFWAMNRNKPGIIKRILNALERFVARIRGKDAYLAVEQRQAAERLRDMLTGELKRAYGTEVKGEAAVESDEGKRYSITSDGKVSETASDDTSSIKEQLRNSLDTVNALESVASVEYSPTNKKELKDRAISEFRKIGFVVDRQNFGKIEIGEKQITNSLNYLNTEAEKAALLTVPKVLKRGEIISGHKDHKGRAYSTITIAAPVEINGVRGNVAATVRQTGASRYYTHRILLPNGSEFIFAESRKNEEPTFVGMPAANDSQRSTISSSPVNSISQADGNVNRKFSENSDVQTIEDGGTVENDSGEFVAESDGNGGTRWSLSTYESSGRETLRQYLDGQVSESGLTEADAKAVLDSMDDIYEICRKYEGEYAPFGAWSRAEVVIDEKGNPVFSVVKPNGEYAMNLDFSLVCKKRRALDAVLNRLIETGAINDFGFGQEEIVRVNEIIREHGFEIACDMCFVDAKRYRQAGVADQFVDLYNSIVKSMAKDGQEIDYFNFANDSSLSHTEGGIDRLSDAELDFSEINEITKPGAKKTVEYRIAQYLKTHPSDRKLLSRGDFMSTVGFDAVKVSKPDILKLYNSKKGTGGPKAAQSDVQYLNDILSSKKFNRSAAYDVGGVRVQSFSDYVPRLVFDYVQMIGDLAAKRLPAHAYTKEPLFAKQFGLTGMKINMSLMPAKGNGKYAGLNADGSYAWARESFPAEEAFRIQADPEYGKNVGTIAVGISDEHIWKMLSDPDIRMVIPYHKSGINPAVAVKLNIGEYTNYTDQQNTRRRDGRQLTKSELKNIPDINRLMHRDGLDAVEASRRYVEWCEDNGYIPKFEKFAYMTDSDGSRVFNENYYKLLEDFTTMVDAEFHPQGDVTATFPGSDSAFGSMADLIKEGLEEDAVTANRLNGEVDGLAEEVRSALGREESGKRFSLTRANGITTEITDDSYDEYEGGYQRRDIKLNGETVGTVAIRIYDDYSEIDRIDIDEKYRNKGIGTTVLGDIAGEFDTTYIVPDNENAKRLYERIGEEVTSGEVYENLDQGYGVYRLDKSYGNTRWSLAGKYDYSKSFADQIDDYKKGLFPVYDTFVVSETPKVWQDIGFNALPVTLNQTHVDYALNGTKDADHEISEADLKKLPEKIKEPIAIIQSQSNPSRAVVFIEMTSKSGKNIVTPVEVDGYGTTNSITIDSNALASMFGKKNAPKQLKNAIDNTVNGKTELFYWDKKRSLALLHLAGLQLPGNLPQDGFVHSIREPGSLVKAKMDDVTNSLQFKRWFGDWKGGKRNVSKVVNRDGSPRVVYHYTDADFEAFDTSKSGSNQGVTHGDGIYVSTNPKEFAYAGKNRLDLYASIKKPFEMQLTKSQAERVYDKYFAPYHVDKYNTYRPHVIEKLQSRSRVFDYLSEAADNGGVRTSDILKELGYDGVHDGSEWVAFDSTQLKSATDNIGTFDRDNPKLKYSLAKSTQSELKALQKENEKLRQDVDDMKQELQLTHGRKLSRDALISSIQKILIDGYGVKLSANELYPEVTNLYDMFYNNTVDGKRLKKGESVDTMRIIEEMDKIVDAVIENAVGVDDTYVEMKNLLPELRNTKLVVPMDARADAAQSAGFENWAEFRKANFGKVGFANEGLPVYTYYMELSERYPELFPDGITNPGEQAAHIADVVNTIRESGINEYQLYDIEDERVRTSIKNDVMDIIGNAEKLQTFADRAAQKVEDTKLAEAMHYGADIAKLKRLNAEKVADIKAENRKRLSDMRRKYQDRVESVRERYAEASKNRTKKQQRSIQEKRAFKQILKYTNLLDKPTTDKHVTEAMRGIMLGLLESVDTVSIKTPKKSTDGDDIGTAERRVRSRGLKQFDTIEKLVLKYQANVKNNLENEIEINQAELDEISKSGIVDDISEWIKKHEGESLANMTLEELTEFNKLFRRIDALSSNIKKLYDPREGLAAKSWQAQKEIGLAQTKEREQVLGAKTEKAREKYEQIHFGALDPAGYYNTLGSDTMTAQFERFRQCQNRFSENIQMFTDRLGEIVDGAIPKDEHGKNAKEVTLKLSRGTLTATPAQLMSIHLMLNQEDSRRCLFNEAGGVIIGKFTAERPKDGKTHIAKKRTFAQSGKLVLNEADAAKITAALTDGQRKRADAISALLNNEAARLGNEVSMAMYGYKKYTTENYFPMRTVDDYRAIADNPNYEMNLLGLSFTKERTGRAGKALVAEDIYDVIGRHLTNMAQYNAFAQELDNAKKMYSLRLGDGTSLKQRIIRSYGKEADIFYSKLINNLSGVQMYTNNSAEALSDKLLSNYKAAAVAGNVSVVLKQPMSIFRALPEFSLAGLKKSMAFEDILNLSPKQLKANTAEMLKYSGIARLKAWGSSENMTRKSFESLYNDNSDTARQKINEFLTSGAENADMWTWAKLWRMSKAEIDAQGKYTAGSKEYFEAVDRKFSDVIGKTQVVQSALDSSMAVQNAKGFGKFLFAFQNEPLKQYSYLISTLNDARRGKPGAKKKLAKVIASSLANTAAVSAISTFMAWLRGTLDRDDDDELLDDLMKEFAGNSIDDLLSGAFAPVWQYIDTIIGAINSGVYGNTVERLDMAALTDLGGLINKYFISQNGGRPNLGTVQDIVNVASNLFGLPAKNIFRDVKSVVDRIILELPVPSAAKYNYLKAWKDVELTNKSAVTEAYYDVLRDAVDRGRYSDYVKIKRDMIYHGYTETKIKNAVMKSSLMDDLYELKKVNPGSYKAKVNSIVSSVSAVSSLEGKEFEDFIESAMKRREREDGGSKTDDEVYDEMHRKMEKEVKEQLIYIDVSKRAAYIKKMLKTYGEYGITEADILKVLRKAGKA